MQDTPLKTLYDKIGAEKRGISLDEFTKDFTTYQDLRETVWKKIGAEAKGISFPEFESDFLTQETPVPSEKTFKFDWGATAKADLASGNYNVQIGEIKPEEKKTSLKDIAVSNINTPFGRRFSQQEDPTIRYNLVGEAAKINEQLYEKQIQVKETEARLKGVNTQEAVDEKNQRNLELMYLYDDNVELITKIPQVLQKDSELRREKALAFIPQREFYEKNFKSLFSNKDNQLQVLEGDFAEWLTSENTQGLFKRWSTDPNFTPKESGEVLQRFIKDKKTELAAAKQGLDDKSLQNIEAYEKLLETSYAQFLYNNPTEKERVVKELQKQKDLQVQPDDSGFEVAGKITKSVLKSGWNTGVNLITDTFVKVPKLGSDVIQGAFGSDLDRTSTSDRVTQWVDSIVDNVTFDLPELKDDKGLDSAGVAATVTNVIGSMMGLRMLNGAVSQLGSAGLVSKLKTLNQAQKAGLLEKIGKAQRVEQFASGMLTFAPRTVESFKQQGMSDSDALATGLLSAAISSSIETVFPNVPFGSAISAKTFLDMAKRGASKKEILKEWGKSLGTAVIQENSEEVADDIINQVILPSAYNKITDGDLDETTLKEYFSEDVATTLALTTLATGLFSGIVSSGQVGELQKFVDLANKADVNEINKIVKGWVNTGAITNKEASDFLTFLKKKRDEGAKVEDTKTSEVPVKQGQSIDEKPATEVKTGTPRQESSSEEEVKTEEFDIEGAISTINKAGGEAGQPPTGEIATNQGGEGEITPNFSTETIDEAERKEILEATKPNIEVSFVGDKVLQNRQIKQEFEEDGAMIEKQVKASAVQNILKKRHKVLKSLLDCIG